MTAATDEGSLLHVVAVRPQPATPHGDELVAAQIADAQSDNGATPFEDVRLSTIYGPDGLPRTAGAELYRPGDELPSRLAGEAVSGSVLELGDTRDRDQLLQVDAGRPPGLGHLRDRAVTLNAPGPDGIRAVICDFGGVLTNKLMDAFAAFQDETGISMDQLGRGMQRVSERDGEYPLFRLERGELTEQEFLDDLAWGLEPELGHRPTLHRFREIWFEALHPNEPMLALMSELGGRGYRMAILTNNVREWEELWRSKLAVDEIFELVVDSAWVGMRKPEPEIYHLTIERLDET